MLRQLNSRVEEVIADRRMEDEVTNNSFIYNFDMSFAYVRPVDNRHCLCLVGLKFSHGVPLLVPTSVLFDQCRKFACIV